MSQVTGVKCDMCGNVWDDYSDEQDTTLCAVRTSGGSWRCTDFDTEGTHICMVCACEVADMYRIARGEEPMGRIVKEE